MKLFYQLAHFPLVLNADGTFSTKEDETFLIAGMRKLYEEMGYSPLNIKLDDTALLFDINANVTLSKSMFFYQVPFKPVEKLEARVLQNGRMLVAEGSIPYPELESFIWVKVPDLLTVIRDYIKGGSKEKFLEVPSTHYPGAGANAISKLFSLRAFNTRMMANQAFASALAQRFNAKRQRNFLPAMKP